MPISDEALWRIAELENDIKSLETKLREERDAVKPILDLYNASKLMGRALVIVGGMTVGATAIWSAIVSILNNGVHK